MTTAVIENTSVKLSDLHVSIYYAGDNSERASVMIERDVMVPGVLPEIVWDTVWMTQDDAERLAVALVTDLSTERKHLALAIADHVCGGVDLCDGIADNLDQYV